MTTDVCACTIDKVREIIAEFPAGKREVLIPMLQAVQEFFGYLPEEAIDAIAERLCLSSAKVYGVATFYNQFRLTPVGKHTVRVCRGTACHVLGSKQILTAMSDELGVQPGGTTEDGQFTLETVACLGACSIAPVVTVDEDFYGAAEPKTVGNIVKKYRE